MQTLTFIFCEVPVIDDFRRNVAVFIDVTLDTIIPLGV